MEPSVGEGVMLCVIDGCGKPAACKRMCNGHYIASRRHGDPLIKKKRQLLGLTVLERLDAYTVKAQGCWQWIGAKSPRGYGVLVNKNGSNLAHRISYELRAEAVPKGMCVLHKCDNPECTNPDHLFLGTRAENNADMKRKSRNDEWGWKSTRNA